jgi:hypothetical protein
VERPAPPPILPITLRGHADAVIDEKIITGQFGLLQQYPREPDLPNRRV